MKRQVIAFCLAGGLSFGAFASEFDRLCVNEQDQVVFCKGDRDVPDTIFGGGAQGPQGEKGDQGERGPAGLDGVDGKDGNAADLAKYDQLINEAFANTRYLERELSAAVASAMAMGQHQFDPTYHSGQVSISGATYNGENAVSIAVGLPLGDNAFFSASAAANSGSGKESLGVGVTIRLP